MHQYKERKNIHTKERLDITVRIVSISTLQTPVEIQHYNKPIQPQISTKKKKKNSKNVILKYY